MTDIFEAPLHPAGPFDPATIVTECIESGACAVLFDEGALPSEFFDLSTRVAGALVQRVTQYDLRMAAVVPDPAAHSAAFQDFAREANRGKHFRFFPDRERAAAWLGAE